MNTRWLFALLFGILCYAGGIPDDIHEKLYYPMDLFTYEQIKHGGSILYFIGIIYMFLGIMQLHQYYLGPCLECLTKIKFVEEDTMISIVRPIAVCAPEFFMCLFTTVFGVTDIGISAFLGTNAFTACIDRGVMFFIAGPLGEIDWFTGYREMLTYIITLFAVAMCLLSNDIVLWNAIIMIVIYFIYWLFMQFNQVIEKKFKSAVGDTKEEDPRLSDSEIKRIHGLKRRKLLNTPEAILKEKYRYENGYVLCEYKGVKAKAMARQVEGSRPKLWKFYNATNKMLCSLMHRKLRYQIKRVTYDPTAPMDEASIIDIENAEFVPKVIPKASTKKVYPIDVNPEAVIDDIQDEKVIERRRKLELLKLMHLEDEDQKYYIKAANMQWKSLVWPSDGGFFRKAFYLIVLPIRAAFYLTLPTPRIPLEDEFNKLPLIYLISLVWMSIFAYFLSWWIVSVSVAYDIPFLILPMILLPLGLLLRDFPHWIQFKRRVDALRRKLEYEVELKDRINYLKSAGIDEKHTADLEKLVSELALQPHKEVIRENYSGPIFSFTLGSSSTWLIYNIVKGSIDLTSSNTWLQVLLLMTVIILKLIFIVKFKFRTSLTLFFIHLGIYICYFFLVIICEYVG